jgi:hypothetical protein
MGLREQLHTPLGVSLEVDWGLDGCQTAPTVLAGSHVTYPGRDIPNATVEPSFLCVVGEKVI